MGFLDWFFGRRRTPPATLPLEDSEVRAQIDALRAEAETRREEQLKQERVREDEHVALVTRYEEEIDRHCHVPGATEYRHFLHRAMANGYRPKHYYDREHPGDRSPRYEPDDYTDRRLWFKPQVHRITYLVVDRPFKPFPLFGSASKVYMVPQGVDFRPDPGDLGHCGVVWENGRAIGVSGLAVFEGM